MALTKQTPAPTPIPVNVDWPKPPTLFREPERQKAFEDHLEAWKKVVVQQFQTVVTAVDGKQNKS